MMISRPLWLLVLTFAVLHCFHATARAQQMTMSIGVLNSAHEFAPELSARDIRVIQKVLGLGADEEVAVKALYDGYAGELASSGAEVREVVREAVERAEVMQDAALLDPAQRRIGEWEKQAEGIKKKFLEDLKSLLTKDQEARWPQVERELRRYKAIGAGRLAGESIDLTRLADEVYPEVWTNLEALEVLEQYAEAIDRAMVARDKLSEEKGGTAWGDLIEKDPRAAETVFKDILRARQQVRDINRRFERQLEGVIAPELASRLRSKFFELSFAQICEPTRSEKFVSTACEAQGLTGDQRAKLLEIKSEYLRARDQWRSRAAAAYEAQESEELPRRLLEALGRIPPNPTGGWTARSPLPADHPLMKLRRERFEMDIAARKRAGAVLSPEQARTLTEDESTNAYFADYTPWWP